MHRAARLQFWVVGSFLCLCVLWRGGKTLDVVFLLPFIVIALVLLESLEPRTQGNVKTRTQRTLWFLVCGFVTLTVASFATSSAKNYGFDELLQTTSLALLFLWCIRFATRHQDFSQRIARIVALTTLLGCAVGVAVYILQPVTRFVGPFFDYRFHTDYWPNAWAEFVLLAWPVTALVVWANGQHRLSKRGAALRVAVMGIVIGALFLSYSRGAFLCFLAQCAVGTVAWIWINHQRKCMRSAIIAGSCTLVVALAFFMGVNALRAQLHPVESVVKKATFTSDEGSSSLTERSQFWRQSMTLIAEKPLLGWGPYSFRFVQPQLQTVVLATADHPHNVFLKLAVERGIPAAFLLLLLILIIGSDGVRRMVHARESSRSADANVALALLVALGGVLAHNLIDFNLQFVGIALPCVLLSCCLVRPLESGAGRRWGARRYIEGIVVVLLLVVAVRESVYLTLSSLGRRYQVRGDTSSAQHYYALAHDEWFERDMLLSHASLLHEDKKDAQARTLLQESISRNPYDGRTWTMLGDVGKAQGDRDEAVRDYIHSYELNGYNDLGPTYALLLLYAEDGATAKANGFRGDAEALMHDVAAAIRVNSHFIALSQNVETLEKMCDLMTRLFPEGKARYDALKRDVQTAAARERATMMARPAGILW